MTLGSLFKKEFKKQGFSQKEIASMVGLSETALSQIITGYYFPSQITLEKLCKVLKVKVVFTLVNEQ